MLAGDHALHIFKALSDQNRLNVFELLLRSDRTNSELMDETGLRQNLLSHHLNILTDAGLIETQQSVGDARRHYYSANLCAVRDFKGWWALRTPPEDWPLPALKKPRRVLFFCLRNLSRSLIAEAIASHIAPDALIVESAGYEAVGTKTPAAALQVLRERGVPSDFLTLKRYDELDRKDFDYLITVCDIVHENSIPAELSYANYAHWSLRDPGEDTDDLDEQLRLTRDLCDGIQQRIALFVQMLAMAE